MKRLNDFLSEDSNQFGPGTDLILSLLAVLLVITLISSYLYSQEKNKNDLNQREGGNFKLASESFLAADFYTRPVTRLVDPQKTDLRVKKIARDYNQSQKEFPYIFIIGHSRSNG